MRLLPLGILFLCACHQEKQSYAQPDSGRPRNQTYHPQIGISGGMRVVASTSLPESFNVYLVSDSASVSILYQLYRGLVSTHGLTGDIEPALAESWQISPDQKTYTFLLREGLKWSDGQPLTTDDVAFTLNQVIDNPGISTNYRDFLLANNQFPQVEVLDHRRIRLTTAKPFAPFLRSLSCPIVPKHILGHTIQPNAKGEIPFNSMWGLTTDVRQIVTNGPWQLAAYIPGERVVLEPNPHYYGHDSGGNPLPYLKQLVTLDVKDMNASLLKFKAGETDVLPLRAEDYDTLKNSQKEGRYHLHNLGPSTNAQFVMFNMSTAHAYDGQPLVDPVKSKWFRDLTFRQALAHAIDKQGMIQSIYKGRGVSQNSHIPQQSSFYNPDTPTYAYDLARARNMLAKAGYIKDEQGRLRDPEGHSVSFELLTNAGNTQRDAACAILRKDWGKLGVEIHYRPVAFQQISQLIHRQFRWEAIMLGMRGNPVEPHFNISRWKLDGRMHLFNMGHPDRWQGKKSTSFTDWEKQIEILYDKAAESFEPEQRRKLYHQAQETEAENLPFLYLIEPLSMVAVRDRLQNIFPSVFGGSGIDQVNWNSEYHYFSPLPDQ